MDRKVKKRMLWAILFSAGFMIYLLEKVNWRHFSLIAERLDIKYFLSAWCVFVFGNFIRALRFYRLDHTGNRLVLWWNINAFYNVTTATLPGGAGEAATAYILKRFSVFNMLGALRILFLSRLLDLFALSALFFVSALLIRNHTPYRETAIWVSGTLLIISSLAFLPISERFVVKVIQRFRSQNRLVQRAYEKIIQLSEISKEQRIKKTYSTTLFHSVVMMALGIITVHLLLKSFGIVLPLVQSAYCYGIYMIFQIIPVQGVAGIGTQAAWWALALNAAGYRGNETIALGFVLHGIFYLFIASMGISLIPQWLLMKRGA